MKSFIAVTQALSDAGRVRMLCALRGGELCACQLIELLQRAPSTVSRHLAILTQAGLVQSRKEGRWVYYRLPRKPEAPWIARITRETFRVLAESETLARDEKRMARIRKADLEALCRRIP